MFGISRQYTTLLLYVNVFRVIILTRCISLMLVTLQLEIDIP